MRRKYNCCNFRRMLYVDSLIGESLTYSGHHLSSGVGHLLPDLTVTIYPNSNRVQLDASAYRSIGRYRRSKQEIADIPKHVTLFSECLFPAGTGH